MKDKLKKRKKEENLRKLLSKVLKTCLCVNTKCFFLFEAVKHKSRVGSVALKKEGDEENAIKREKLILRRKPTRIF